MISAKADFCDRILVVGAEWQFLPFDSCLRMPLRLSRVQFSSKFAVPSAGEPPNVTVLQNETPENTEESGLIAMNNKKL